MQLADDDSTSTLILKRKKGKEGKKERTSPASQSLCAQMGPWVVCGPSAVVRGNESGVVSGVRPRVTEANIGLSPLHKGGYMTRHMTVTLP